jgi:hypothetical protein
MRKRFDRATHPDVEGLFFYHDRSPARVEAKSRPQAPQVLLQAQPEQHSSTLSFTFLLTYTFDGFDGFDTG